MKFFRTLLAVALLAASTTAMAQTRKVVDRVDQRVEKVLDRQDVSYQFKSHAFLDLQGGAQYTLGEAKFKDLISCPIGILMQLSSLSTRISSGIPALSFPNIR